LARYGKRSNTVAEKELSTYVHAGVARLEQEILRKTFSELGVSKVDT
jgi:hypothetical protein